MSSLTRKSERSAKPTREARVLREVLFSQKQFNSPSGLRTEEFFNEYRTQTRRKEDTRRPSAVVGRSNRAIWARPDCHTVGHHPRSFQNRRLQTRKERSSEPATCGRAQIGSSSPLGLPTPYLTTTKTGPFSLHEYSILDSVSTSISTPYGLENVIQEVRKEIAKLTHVLHLFEGPKQAKSNAPRRKISASGRRRIAAA
jgi:hypothetical protein